MNSRYFYETKKRLHLQRVILYGNKKFCLDYFIKASDKIASAKQNVKFNKIPMMQKTKRQKNSACMSTYLYTSIYKLLIIYITEKNFCYKAHCTI